jgi:uncharacterized protein (DUF1697 family)
MRDTYVALMRGINVGGKNKLPKQDLVELFVAAGCSNVLTYIQSGNIIFRASPAVAAKVPLVITAKIGVRFGYRIPVVVRTVEEIRKVVLQNPFLKEGADEDTLHVMFLADHPSPQQIATLNPDRSPPDVFRVLGRDIYLHLPTGMAHSKLTNAYFDSKLATIGTVRNWRTVSNLLAMMEVK